MGATLPDLPFEAFRGGIERVSPAVLPEATIAALHRHYAELRRWNPRLSLIGPGTAAEVLARHYGESLAALPLLPPGPATLVDVGSGAGFPGLVLAAARPDLRVTLVEPRQRKWAFLSAAVRAAGLSCSCLDARVERPLPAGLLEPIDLITSRAVKLPPVVLEALADRSPRLRFLFWCGAEDPPLPSGFAFGSAIPLPGSDRRRIASAERGAPSLPSPPTP